MSAKSRPTARKRSDKRSKWHKARKATVTPAFSTLDSAPAFFALQVDAILDMSLEELPSVIVQAHHPENVKFQSQVIEACLTRILNQDNTLRHSPRPEQVRTLRRLIFNKSDVLLIARTGFGKSIIFHAYSILTQKITLQLVPLTKLGEEQVHEIQRLPGARPCLINARTSREERRLIERVGNGEFTHILMGPEQASSRTFRKALKRTEFQARIGLVAIDECHLVLQWEKFRPAFTMLGQLRTILHSNVVWFGCSATLDALAEERVLTTAGFRQVGSNKHQTTVIRTSVDRPDVAISVVPLPRQKLTAWDNMFFLLKDAIDGACATPEKIPKTIVFIDGRRKIGLAAIWAMETLIQMSSSYSPDVQYGDELSAGPRCVLNVVRIYTANVSQFDQDATFAELCKPDSRVRIVFATTTLGMGINIPDVDRVVTYQIPISESLGDLWQRIGRGGRGEGRTSRAIVMLPYWLFDSEGKQRVQKDNPVDTSIPLRFPSSQLSRPLRNLTPGDRATVRAQVSTHLSQSLTPGDLSDVDTDQADIDQSTSEPMSEKTFSSKTKDRYWTVQEVELRNKLPASWLRMVNGRCHRKGFLEDLGENKLPASDRQRVAAEQCCSLCNPSLAVEIIPPPSRLMSLKQPRGGSKAATILSLLETFAEERATEMYSTKSTGYPLPAGLYLSQHLRWQLSYSLAESACTATTVEQMCSAFPFLSTWDHLEEEYQRLAAALPDIRLKTLEQIREKQKQKQKRKADQALASQQNETTAPVLAKTSEDRRSVLLREDDRLAMVVAQGDARTFRQMIPPPAVYATREEVLEASAPSPLSSQSTLQPLTPHIQTPQKRAPLREQRPAEYNKKYKRQPDATPTNGCLRKSMLTFTPRSLSGRIRTLSEKGKNTYGVSPSRPR